MQERDSATSPSQASAGAGGKSRARSEALARLRLPSPPTARGRGRRFGTFGAGHRGKGGRCSRGCHLRDSPRCGLLVGAASVAAVGRRGGLRCLQLARRGHVKGRNARTGSVRGMRLDPGIHLGRPPPSAPEPAPFLLLPGPPLADMCVFVNLSPPCSVLVSKTFERVGTAHVYAFYFVGHQSSGKRVACSRSRWGRLVREKEPPLGRQQEIEEKLIEEETARRVEELVAKRVEEELEKRKDEIEREVLRRVEEAKRIMEKQLLEELERQRQAELAAQKAREEEERAKREELERILEENNRKIAEAQAKLAEEQLRIVEEQRKIHEERMKLEQERQRQQKEEQKIILGKGKSRPKLSFSLKTQD
ncbi:arginine and glutamate-rich protein 1 [Carlito syrichta]|uniref:Arginine and glutamate-rich protein 1 n=1 Tax=Carlito syrichta TaxID=1868482 RepID=A0A1U7U709_CARSF|nr:arginine and glutamate-rich protein 1 [Carlito syrichta]